MNTLVEYKETLLKGNIKLKNKRQYKANEEENMLKLMFKPKINTSINENSKLEIFMHREQEENKQDKQTYITFEENNDTYKINYDLDDIKGIKEIIEYESSMKKLRQK